MIEVLKKIPEGEYWSKSETFLLPLTGLSKTQKYPIKTYLFWENYTIDMYQFIMKMSYHNYDEFVKYCKKVIFPTLDKNNYLIESYDFDGESIFVLDLGEWALDIEMFLRGRYSKLSRDAKKAIIEYHTYFDRGAKIEIEISAVLEPDIKYSLLGGMTAIEYVADNYGISLEELKKLGELGSIYEKDKETLNGYTIREKGNTPLQSVT